MVDCLVAFGGLFSGCQAVVGGSLVFSDGFDRGFFIFQTNQVAFLGVATYPWFHFRSRAFLSGRSPWTGVTLSQAPSKPRKVGSYEGYKTFEKVLLNQKPAENCPNLGLRAANCPAFSLF